MHTSCGRARVLTVLAHSALFKFPLTCEEVVGRWWCLPGEVVPDHRVVGGWLHSLLDLSIVSSYDHYWSICDFATLKSWVGDRYQRKIISSQKKIEALDFVKNITKIPWISAVGITGSVALDSAREDDDIDFFFIIQKNRLWLTRLVVLFFATLMGRRRSFAGAESNSWCFNLWLEESRLEIDLESRSFYSAYEVCQVDWIFNKDSFAKEFLVRNDWVSSRLPVYYSRVVCKASELIRNVDDSIEERRSKNYYQLLLSKLGDCLNLVGYFLQKIYMSQHLTREKVGLRYAFFHPTERSKPLLRVIRFSILKNEKLKTWGYFEKEVVADEIVDEVKKVGGRVLVTGVFDVLHVEHLRFLHKARALGDFLTIGVETDERVRSMKGVGRPVNSQSVRVENLKKLEIADEVFILPKKFSSEADHKKLLARVKPDVLAVSSHTNHLKKKQKLMREIGGVVAVVHEHNPDVSTTKLIAKQSKLADAKF